MRRIELLPRHSLVRTSEVDHADWNYRTILGFLQRTRFRLVVRLMDDLEPGNILEIGYGSGVFFPELDRRGRSLSGVDIHDKTDEVRAALHERGLEADIHSCSVTEMPFADDAFDCAIAISALEYVVDIDRGCREILRVLRPGAPLILVTPGQSPLLDFGLRVLGGENADDNYGDRRRNLMVALERHFVVDRLIQWPVPGLTWFTVYRALRLRARD